MVLIDSSIWITYFKNSREEVSEHVDSLLDDEFVCTAGMILQEVFQGIKTEREHRVIASKFNELPYLETGKSTHYLAARLWREMRKNGVTIPSTDALIAAVAIENGVPLYSIDTHFKKIPSGFNFKLW